PHFISSQTGGTCSAASAPCGHPRRAPRDVSAPRSPPTANPATPYFGSIALAIR
uniref:Uncharacterized protein n=1 Tax=Aegilops tauschii subsp. strangulata TaxID=200361 RepID=A0A453DWQ8_AEGTS